MKDATILAQALSFYAEDLRRQSTLRKYAGEYWKETRAEWRATANRAVELATQAASMAEVFEEPRLSTFDVFDHGKRVGTVRG